MGRLPKGAPKISVQKTAGTLTLEGELAWTEVRDGLGLRRQTTDYKLVLPIDDLPFDRGFKALAKGETRVSDDLGALVVGDPKEIAETDAGSGLKVAAYRAGPGEAPEGLSAQGLIVAQFVKIFDQGALDGSQYFQAFISMNPAMTAITDIRVGMLIEQPVIWTDGWTEETYMGRDAFSGRIALSALGLGKTAGGGPQVATGGKGDDALTGGGRDDLLEGRGGNDVLKGLGGEDRLVGGAGGDRLFGGGGDDRLVGGVGRDRLVGGGGDDRLLGGPGADDLRGGRGADRLVDGAGVDVMRGGAGADVFVLSHDGARDRIADFDPGRDLIDLTAFGRGHAFEDLSLVSRQGAVILHLEGEALRIQGAHGALDPAELDADAFLFA